MFANPWILFALGIILGALVTILIYLARTSGTLKIDQTNPEKDVYRLEINDLDSLIKKQRVVLKVDKNADLSQK